MVKIGRKKKEILSDVNNEEIVVNDSSNADVTTQKKEEDIVTKEEDVVEKPRYTTNKKLYAVEDYELLGIANINHAPVMIDTGCQYAIPPGCVGMICSIPQKSPLLIAGGVYCIRHDELPDGETLKIPYVYCGRGYGYIRKGDYIGQFLVFREFDEITED